MFRVDELERHFKCTYPNSVSDETQKRRRTNISALQSLVMSAIEENSLRYGVLEERLHLFTTVTGEKIYIQYPGKESAAAGENRREMDFRPRIMAADGTMVRDLVFADMWRLVEDLNHRIHALLKTMACLFFRLGRMTLHDCEEAEYSYELVNSDGTVCGTGTRRLSWYRVHFEQEVLDSFSIYAPELVVDAAPPVSLEAFIYFFEMILQNEDSKYYDKKHDLTSGRIPTSDSMLLLSSNLFGITAVSELLQRFVSGRGVATCRTEEIAGATDGLVKIVNRKKELCDWLESRGIRYLSGVYISVNKKKYRAAVKTNSPKTAVLTAADSSARTALEGVGWTVFSLDELVPDEAFEAFCMRYSTL